MGGETKRTGESAEAESDQPLSLAERITVLFERIRRPDGEPFTLRQVAAGMSERLGESISYQSVGYLKSGQHDNPTRDRLQALADFFGVPPAYFFDDKASQEIVKQIETATALRHGPLRDLALELLRKTKPVDVELVAALVRTLAGRPDLRDVIEVALTLDPPELQLGGDLLRSLQRRRGSDSET
ncbi:helix-turn-helix domain-containing protein [Amycolatopsis coloradensis]|uniref:helix-turn-helix domain-containing protein n=1 Tax=Amycolatopsis coloradensis TaxID=76021 RepID=UPI001301936F|nr:helix-turn-helix transcriptional regulator [Amycolatopsis coloradensis]